MAWWLRSRCSLRTITKTSQRRQVGVVFARLLLSTSVQLNCDRRKWEPNIPCTALDMTALLYWALFAFLHANSICPSSPLTYMNDLINAFSSWKLVGWYFGFHTIRKHSCLPKLVIFVICKDADTLYEVCDCTSNFSRNAKLLDEDIVLYLDALTQHRWVGLKLKHVN